MEEIIIQKQGEYIRIIVLEGGKIVESYDFNESQMPKIGNIYIGRIKDVKPKNNTIFVDYGFDKAGFLQLNSLDKVYKKGEKILVQIKTEERDEKGAKLSSSLSIAGKFVVLLIDSNIFSISSKIQTKLEDIKEQIKQRLPQNFGIIIRTEAQNANSEEIFSEIDNLLISYNNISQIIQNEEIGLIYDANTLEEKITKEFIKKSTKKIYINDEDIYNKISELTKAEAIEDLPMSEIVYSKVDFIKEFGIEGELEKANSRKIWLKSGGYIAIDKTEALTAIDVNTGKFLGEKRINQEEIAYKINQESAIEAMRQIRLKNIGGIIIIDFINMKDKEHKNNILSILNAEKYKDRGKIEVIDYTKLGLVEITRKKL